MTTDEKIVPPDEDQEVLDAFLKRANFPYSWLNLESSARRMVERAVYELEQLNAQVKTLTAERDAAEVRVGALICERSPGRHHFATCDRHKNESWHAANDRAALALQISTQNKVSE